MRALPPIATLAVALCAALIQPVPANAERVLRYTDHEPLGGMRTRFIKDVFFAAVEKESKGAIRIKDNWNGSVSASYDALKTIGDGNNADIGIAVPEYTAAALPLQQIFKSFPVGPTGARQVAFFRRVYAEVSAFSAEFAKNNVVNILSATGYPVAFFSIAPLASLEGLNGHTWRTASFWHRDFLANVGAKPVSIRWGEAVFNAIKAKTLEGLVVNIDSGYMLKVHEVAPHVIASKDLWLGHVYPLVMNAKVFGALSASEKLAIRRAADTSYAVLGAIMDKSFDAMVDDIRRAGANIRLLTKAEAGAFASAARYRDVQAAWVKQQEAKGVKDAGEVMEKVRAMLDEAMK